MHPSDSDSDSDSDADDSAADLDEEDSSDAFLRDIARIDSAPRAELAVGSLIGAPAIGTKVGRFTLLEELGRGGMGIVFRAEDAKLDRIVALKVLRTTASVDRQKQDLRARFLREAKLAAAIVHPNVATIYEVGADEQAGEYIAMELVRGKTLRDALPELRDRSRRADLLEVAKGIAQGLSAAHDRGIVHRDLKPENIILAQATNAPKILDFGLAKLHTAPRATTTTTTHHSTEAGRILGTPAYMSPEQAAGKAKLDARSDLFSFGVILYEGLSGVRPFDGDTSQEVLAAVMRDPPTPLRRIAPDVAKPLADLVHRCLAKNPSDRPADIKEILATLERVPVFHRASRWPFVVGLLAIAALATIIAASSTRTPKIEPASQPRGTAATTAAVVSPPLLSSPSPSTSPPPPVQPQPQPQQASVFKPPTRSLATPSASPSSSSSSSSKPKRDPLADQD